MKYAPFTPALRKTNASAGVFFVFFFNPFGYNL